MLNYLRTHAYETEDRRPDTANISTRAEYTANPSSAVEAPSSSEEAVSSSAAAEETVQYQASYRVDKTGGGSLTSGSESGKSIVVNVTSAAQQVSVTAVPDEGYVFVNWSDGVTKKTRTDTGFKQNVDVTAVFAAASIQISTSGAAKLGDSYTFKATLKGKHLDASSIRWYANGTEVTQAAGRTTVKVEVDPAMLGATFHVYATASYNDCTVTSNKVEVTVSGAASSSSSSSSGSSGSGSSSSTSSGSSGTTSASGTESSSSKEEKPASSASNGSSSHSSTSHSSSAISGTSGSSHSSSAASGSSSHSSSASSSASSASSKEEKPAESKAEASASREATNEEAVSAAE